jgi:succinate dehydrogenase/fumarate reductase flavoprotein subunit
MSERESMAYDVVIVGAGPAGLAARIRLKQLAAEAGASFPSASSKRARKSARTSCRAR